MDEALHGRNVGVEVEVFIFIFDLLVTRHLNLVVNVANVVAFAALLKQDSVFSLLLIMLMPVLFDVHLAKLFWVLGFQTVDRITRATTDLTLDFGVVTHAFERDLSAHILRLWRSVSRNVADGSLANFLLFWRLFSHCRGPLIVLRQRSIRGCGQLSESLPSESNRLSHGDRSWFDLLLSAGFTRELSGSF